VGGLGRICFGGDVWGCLKEVSVEGCWFAWVVGWWLFGLFCFGRAALLRWCVGFVGEGLSVVTVQCAW